MSQQQVIHFRILKFLLTQLKNFGLNPTDWRVDRDSSIVANKILLVHKEDQQFKFVGILGVTNGLPRWQNLTLLSV